MMTQDLDMAHRLDTNGHANLVMVIESDVEKYNVLYGTDTKTKIGGLTCPYIELNI